MPLSTWQISTYFFSDLAHIPSLWSLSCTSPSHPQPASPYSFLYFPNHEPVATSIWSFTALISGVNFYLSSLIWEMSHCCIFLNKIYKILLPKCQDIDILNISMNVSPPSESPVVNSPENVGNGPLFFNTHPVHCWIDVTRADIFVLFLILRAKHPVFHHYFW